jgi:fructose-bisphosphate aldolase, class I
MPRQQNVTQTAFTPRVREILSWYRSENLGVQSKIATLLTQGALAGTGRMLILPVDQGFEHGPARSFAPNPEGYSPHFHFELAIESGCCAYAAPYGQLAAAAPDFVGQIPLIVKVNSNDTLYPNRNPVSAVTCSINDAVKLGASAIGFTIYPGTSFKKEMYEEIRELGEEARAAGLAVVIWSYPRGEGISKEGETALDIVAYSAHIAAQLGAHLIKVKLPTSELEQEAAKKVYLERKIPRKTLKERVQHVVQSCFAGRRIVIFSGGEAKGDAELMKEIREIRGRNAFQRSRKEALKLLASINEVYRG